LQFATSILRREVNALPTNKQFVLAPGDRAFLNSLPPSFMDQFNSMALLVNWEDIGPMHLRELFLRLLDLCIRNAALPVLVLTTLCDDFLKPFLISPIILF
jgi:hypothetical protein